MVEKTERRYGDFTQTFKIPQECVAIFPWIQRLDNSLQCLAMWEKREFAGPAPSHVLTLPLLPPQRQVRTQMEVLFRDKRCAQGAAPLAHERLPLLLCFSPLYPHHFSSQISFAFQMVFTQDTDEEGLPIDQDIANS